MIIVVIVPTYNERENIGLLLGALDREFKTITHDMHVLVVDDNSPDGTARVVQDLMKTHPYIHLITGQKQGLGAAYIRGMTHAMEALQADAVMEMDADFSHKPEDVPRLITALEAGADFIIGSRYVTGGTVPSDWGLLRIMISRWGNIFARYVGGLHRVRDCTAGFRAIRVSILRQINLGALKVKGYAFQIALLNQALAANAIVTEIPVEFIDRKYGNTKLGIRDIIEFLNNVWWIRFQNSKTFIKFAMVGTTGLVVNLGVFSLLIALGLNKFVASPIAIQVSILTNFIFNNIWTFRHRDTKDSLHLKGLKFNVVSLFSLCISYLTFVLISMALPSRPPQIHQAIGVIPAILVNYFLNTYWTFREKDKDYQ